MSVGLKLLPVANEEIANPETVFAETVITAFYGISHSLYYKLKRLPVIRPLEQISVPFLEDPITEDYLGTPLHTVQVRDLLKFKDDLEILNNPRPKAAWSYLLQLAPNKEIVLFWD